MKSKARENFLNARIVKLIAICAALTVALTAHANDSTARLGAGGLELTRSDQIRMAEEVLEISQTQIRVHYKFFNDSRIDVKTIVAFPMPRYRWNPRESQMDANIGPLKSFQTWADGVPSSVTTDTKAYLKGKDITSVLRSNGLAGERLTAPLWCSLEMVSAKVCLSESLNRRVPGVIDDGRPMYEIQETAWWEQTFPKGKTVMVDHTYQPKAGQIYGFFRDAVPDSEWLRPWKPGGGPGTDDPRVACMHEGGQAAVAARVKRLVALNEGPVSVVLNDVEYVLGTGRNWKGPIEKFLLRIKKQSPEQIISLCFPGKARRIDPLTIEFEATNFVPQDSLVVYFFTIETQAQIDRKPPANVKRKR